MKIIDNIFGKPCGNVKNFYVPLHSQGNITFSKEGVLAEANE